MLNVLRRASLGPVLSVLLTASGCHLDTLSEHPTLSEQHRPSVTEIPHRLWPVPLSVTANHTTAARQLVSQLEQDAAQLPTSADRFLPEGEARQEMVATLPPLAFVSHLSSYIHISPDGTPTAERYILAPFSLAPPSPLLFEEADLSGQGLGLDMGLTFVDLPAEGALEWSVAVQAYCACPQSPGLHQSPDGRARLDFSTGRFRLSAGFGDNKALRSVGMDMHLDQDRLARRLPQPASAELGFETGNPSPLSGELSLYLSGRNARHIGGEFLSADTNEMSLSDILFVMQFAGSAR